VVVARVEGCSYSRLRQEAVPDHNKTDSFDPEMAEVDRLVSLPASR
jgi:hypothetical protein